MVFFLAIPDFGVLLRVFFVTTTGLTPNVVRWVFCGVTEGNNCKLSSFALLKFVRTCSNGKILVPDDSDTVSSKLRGLYTCYMTKAMLW